MHAISSYRGNRPRNTHPQTHTQTNKQIHRQDRSQYTAPQLAIARSVMNTSNYMYYEVTNLYNTRQTY